MANIFAEVKRQMQKKNCCAEVFTFVDAIALTSKLAMWEERDKSIKYNMKIKNKDPDRWISKLRSPYERTFSKQNKKVRYHGVAKNQAAEFLYAVAYNFKRLLVLEPELIG